MRMAHHRVFLSSIPLPICFLGTMTLASDSPAEA